MTLRWTRLAGGTKHIAAPFVYRGGPAKLRFEVKKAFGKEKKLNLLLVVVQHGSAIGISGPYQSLNEAQFEAERMIEAGEVTL